MGVNDVTLTVLALLLATAARPILATMAQRHGPRATRRKHNPARAGGGAAMLVMAGFLISRASYTAGQDFWVLMQAAPRDPYVRLLPDFWLPMLCWLVLVIGGLWLLASGIRGAKPPRHPMTVIWALNEIAICAALLLWGIYVPDDYNAAQLIDFGLEGIYLSFLIGAVLRFILVLLSPTPAPHSIETERSSASGWIGRMRRF